MNNNFKYLVPVNSHKVEICRDPETERTDVIIDGNKLRYVRGLTFEQEPTALPLLTIELTALPDIDTDAMVAFKISPESYKDAAKLLLAGMKSDSKLRHGLYSSVFSAIREKKTFESGITEMDLAEAIVERLLNED